MQNLEKTVTEERLLSREIFRAFNSVSVGGIVLGALTVYGGIISNSEIIQGFGYGVLAMDALMNVVYRGIRSLQPRE